MKAIRIKLLITLLFYSVANAAAPTNFNQSKIAMKNIFSDSQVTLYCNCSYNSYGQISKTCPIKPTKYISRAFKIEIEHIFPMSQAKHHFSCWRIGGRKYCGQTDAKFNKLEAELYNLFPAIGSINAARANFNFIEFSTVEKLQLQHFDNCPIYINFATKQVEPRDEIKGLIARANLFVSSRYNIKLSASQRKLFQAWNKKFPPTTFELQWAAKIAKIQGYTNPYITQYIPLNLKHK